MLVYERLLTDLREHQATETHWSISIGFFFPSHYVCVNTVVYGDDIFLCRVSSSRWLHGGETSRFQDIKAAARNINNVEPEHNIKD